MTGGGKSRKTGGISKALINRIVGKGTKTKTKKSGKSNVSKQRPNFGLLESD